MAEGSYCSMLGLMMLSRTNDVVSCDAHSFALLAM